MTTKITDNSFQFNISKILRDHIDKYSKRINSKTRHLISELDSKYNDYLAGRPGIYTEPAQPVTVMHKFSIPDPDTKYNYTFGLVQDKNGDLHISLVSGNK